MASIPGSVRVGGFIAPSDTTDTYATHDSLYGRGGLKEVSSTEERDAIPADRRREGMIVYVGGVVQANYQLIGGIDNANWAVLEAGGGGGVTDHGALTGLNDDDHTQYLNETRHDLLDHTGLTGIPSITGLLDETAHDLLDHTGLTGIPTQYTDEMAQDAIGTLITNGTQSGITVSYDDANNKLDFTVTASGGGDVTGPSSATDGNIVLFDGVTGKVIKDSAYNPSSFAAALGADDNYVTDAEKAALHSHSNKTALDSVSGINTGDQDLSGYSLTTHNHAGEYEPADATILKDADIGVTVQAYDADLTSWAAITPSAKQDTLISGTNIKTINSTSLLGSGNIVIEGGGADIPYQNDAPSNPSDGDLWVDKDAIASGSASLLVAETVVSGSAVTSVTFSGLDGNAAGGYVLACNFWGTGENVAYLYVNSDTTGSNYTGLRISSYNTTVGSNVPVGPVIGYSSDDSTKGAYYNVYVSQANNYTLINSRGQHTGGIYLTNEICVVRHNASQTNITSLTIACSNIAIGSTFRLYRRK